MPEEAWCRTSRDGAVWTLAAGGRWTLDRAASLEAELTRLDASGATESRLDLSHLEALDTAGAWLLFRLYRRLEHDGVRVEWVGTAPAHAALLQRMAPAAERKSLARADMSPIRAMVERVGRATFDFGGESRDLVNFKSENTREILAEMEGT